jgi:hypothetical protein
MEFLPLVERADPIPLANATLSDHKVHVYFTSFWAENFGHALIDDICRLMIGPPQGEKEGTRSYAVCVSERQVGGEDRIDHRGVLVWRRVTMTLRFRFSLLCTTSALTQHWLSLQSGDHSSTEGTVIVQCEDLP